MHVLMPCTYNATVRRVDLDMPERQDILMLQVFPPNILLAAVWNCNDALI